MLNQGCLSTRHDSPALNSRFHAFAHLTSRSPRQKCATGLGLQPRSYYQGTKPGAVRGGRASAVARQPVSQYMCGACDWSEFFEKDDARLQNVLLHQRRRVQTNCEMQARGVVSSLFQRGKRLGVYDPACAGNWIRAFYAGLLRGWLYIYVCMYVCIYSLLLGHVEKYYSCLHDFL